MKKKNQELEFFDELLKEFMKLFKKFQTIFDGYLEITKELKKKLK